MRTLTDEQWNRFGEFRPTLPQKDQEGVYSYFNGLVRFSLALAQFLVQEDKLVPVTLTPQQVRVMAEQYNLHRHFENGHRVLGEIDEEWALEHADISQPIFFCDITFQGKELTAFIDGHHRLFRACYEGKSLRMYIFKDDQVDVISPSLREIEQLGKDR